MDARSIRPPSLQGELSSSDEKSDRTETTIGTLTDTVLLNIFDFYRKNHEDYLGLVWTWHVLVHVCQRWRQLVYASPNHLKLQILCTSRTPVRENLGIWPAFPITIECRDFESDTPSNDEEDNIIAALEHPDRVCRIMLDVPGPQLAKMVTVMQEPFPVLTELIIASADEDVQALPSKFLGGSAPCLQKLGIHDIPYPALPTLLLSTTNLITLKLVISSPRGYFSPETIVGCLSALPKLETLAIEFDSESDFPRPDQIHLPPVTRIVLPALTLFQFEGAGAYLEDLVAQIDGPQLNKMHIFYLDQVVDAPVAQLPKFVDRSVGPKLTLLNHGDVRFASDITSFTMSYYHPEIVSFISLEGLDWQASRIAELLGQFSTTEILSNVVHLRLRAEFQSETDDVEWLHLFQQFSAVQSLEVSQELAVCVALVLEGITGEMVTKVLPSLNLIYLAGRSASSVEKFVAARELSDRPVTVVDTITEFSERLESSGVSKYQLQVLYEEPTDEIWSGSEFDDAESDVSE